MQSRTAPRGAPPDPRRTRPFGVTVIATIHMLTGVAWAAVTVFDRPDYAALLGALGYYEFAGPALALAGLLIAYGLFTLRRRAWVLTMLWAGLNLTAALYGWWHGEPAYVAMVLSVVTVYYLNQREVQAAFRVPQRQDARDDD